jgi:hypothetical protein
MNERRFPVTYRAELANAARWVKAAAERLPVQHRPDLALEWAELSDRLEDCRSDGSRELCLIEWRAEMAERLDVGLAPGGKDAPGRRAA